MKIESLMNSHVKELIAYEPPDWAAAAARAGLQPEQLVRLDANENPYGPSPQVIAALSRYDSFAYYPDYRGLATAVARYANTTTERVALGNGGDEIIDLIVRLFVEPGDRVVICPPAFGMYSLSTQAHRGHLLSVPRGDDFALDVEAIERVVSDSQPKLLFVTSPGNPDGLAIPTEVLRRLAQLPVVVVVDEAYVEFGGESVVPWIGEAANLIVVRTFSKWAGMAGLRLGYAVAAEEIAGALARLRPPYNLNIAAVVAARATLANLAPAQETLGRIISERDRLYVSLLDLPGALPVPSQANFLLVRLDGRSGAEVAEALAATGIMVRSFSDPALNDTLRITVGRPSQNDALLAALQAVLRGEAPPRPVLPQPREPQAGSSDKRRATIHRQTGETEVEVTLDLDGTGQYDIDTGLGFLDHMLAQVAAHGLLDLRVRAKGDLMIDEHHTVEDTAIGLGQALDEALRDRRGLVRMGSSYAPLDEALARIVVDLSGRPYAVVQAEFSTPRIGTVGSDLLIHFLETVAFHARLSLHARVLYGRNDHHKAEALFKALGRALNAATRLDPRRQGVPSTKGVL